MTLFYSPFKKIFTIITTIVFSLLNSGFGYANDTNKGIKSQTLNQPKNVTVVITQLVSHKALNDVRDGTIDTIEDCSKPDFDVQFMLSNASGNAITARQVAQKHASDKPDVIVAISTLSAQSVISSTRGTIPVVFGAVTDPNAAKISRENVTGVTDQAPFADQIRFIKTLIPTIETIAIMYNPGEDNSRAALAQLEPILADENLTLFPIAVTKVVEIPQGVLKARNQAQAIFIANDNLVASGFESLIGAAKKINIPVFASDVMLVHRGAVAMRGIDYYQSGQQLGLQVCSILRGKSANDIPVQKPAELKLLINEKAAKDFGITIPDDIRKEADAIISMTSPNISQD